MNKVGRFPRLKKDRNTLVSIAVSFAPLNTWVHHHFSKQIPGEQAKMPPKDLSHSTCHPDTQP